MAALGGLSSITQDGLRSAVLLDVRPGRVQYMMPDELTAMQSRLGYGDCYGVWATPREWMPAGSRRLSLLRIDIRERLTYCGVPVQHIDDALLYCTRYAVLLALTPSAMGLRLRNKSLKPHSIQGILYKTVPFLIAASVVRSKGNGHYMDLLEERDFQHNSPSQKEAVSRELARIHMFCDRGLWLDRPSLVEAKKGDGYTPEVAGPDVRPKKEAKPDKFKPLPDSWVAEAGWRALWLVKELGPSLLILARQLAQVVRDIPYVDSGVSKTRINQRRRARAIPLIAAHRWIGRGGQEIVSPPFPLMLTSGRTTPTMVPEQWPPTHVPQILTLLHLLQYAHLFIALLAVGGRISEMLSLGPNAITRSSDGTPFVNGLTFKLTQLLEGKERDWPLPDITLEAINQQEALREILTGIGLWTEDPKKDQSGALDSLWLGYGGYSELSNAAVNHNLRQLAKSIGLATDPADQNLSSHRFRKTVARLVALAVVGAPKILMDLFGHKSIEMTLDYILTNPDIAAEARLISEEMIIMRATTAIKNIDDYGGRAAKSIKRMVEQERFRLGKDLGAKDIRELAEVLTMNGQAWELSRPGVICTKLPGSPSPCARKVGHPEPSRCMSDCDNRLEEAFLRKDVDGAIAESIQHYETERNGGNRLMQDFWAGQVLTHLNRFDDLGDKWSAHSSVMEILSLVEQPA